LGASSVCGHWWVLGGTLDGREGSSRPFFFIDTNEIPDHRLSVVL